MTQSEPTAKKRHHFLFHIFRMEKAENPMPQNRAQSLWHYLKNVFTDTPKN